MGLFDLVEEHDAVGLAADLLGELSRLVIADVARGRADDAGDREFLHKLRHVKADQALRRIEQVGRKLLDKLGLADAGGADEDKAHGLALDLKADAASADRGADGVHRLILPDDMRFEASVQIRKALELIGPHGGCGDLGPELDDPCEVIHAQSGHGLCLQLPQFGLALHFAASERGDAGIALVQQLVGQLLPVGRVRAHEGLALKADVFQIARDLGLAADIGVFEVHVGAGLVDEVDGLIRQEAVGDVALAQKHGLTAHLVADGDAVVVLVIVRDAAQDLHALLDGGLVDGHGLEAPLKRRVLLDMLAVLGEGRGADHLDLPAGKGGL